MTLSSPTAPAEVQPATAPRRVPRLLVGIVFLGLILVPLAIGRLSFCGGFDVDDPEILAEAAAAAGLDLDACLLAAVNPWTFRWSASSGRHRPGSWR